MKEDQKVRLLSVRDGLVSGLLAVRHGLRSITGPNNAYLPPKRFTKKYAAAKAKLDILRQVETVIENHLHSVVKAYIELEDKMS